MKILLSSHQTQHSIPSLYCSRTITDREHTINPHPSSSFYTPLTYSSPHHLFFHTLDSRLIRFIWGVLALLFQYHILNIPSVHSVLKTHSLLRYIRAVCLSQSVTVPALRWSTETERELWLPENKAFLSRSSAKKKLQTWAVALKDSSTKREIYPVSRLRMLGQLGLSSH